MTNTEYMGLSESRRLFGSPVLFCKLEFGEVSTHAVILSERSESKDLPTWGGG